MESIMTETEELKANTVRSLVRQRLDAISEYIKELMDSCEHRRRWAVRCDILVNIAFLGNLALIAIVLTLDVPETVNDIASQLLFMVFIVAMVREWKARKRWHVKEGEWNGAIHTLKLLGMLPDTPEPGVRKRKRRTFKEGVDMVKQWAITKQKARDTAYAPV